MEQPFAGIRVIEAGGTVAVAAATKTLGDFGADVIKLEPPGGGDLRRLPPFPDDRPHVDSGAFHLALDTGKRSAVVDLATPSGREVLSRLCAGAELLVLELPADRAEAALARVPAGGPSTVSISPHGHDGPFRERRENDMSLFAWTSRMNRHGADGEQPLRYAPQVATMQVGATAGAAAAAALWGRSNGGGRISIEVAGVEALAGNVDTWFTIWSFSGAEFPRSSGPSRVVYAAGNYECADGHLLFAAQQEPFFSRLCAAIGQPGLPRDERFASAEARAQHYDDFMQHLGPWLAARTREQAFTELQSAGVMVAPVLEIPEVLADRQARARGSFVELEQPVAGKTTIAGPPFRLAEGWEARPAPRLGEHTAELLDEAGYTRDEQIALFRAGVTA